ncbi:flippase [candidate division KSB1 bacterium]|nr:flippase [candidate division KSB1 bacterium]NIR68860.1 flippase [candidate division KSB1 bacterium]NIS27228.1 flippase [candidate division KSB1 bacterium]NIT74113.1 flippase [candidate division KSB1 bacterium]NIU27962.1 flippase [candidate division KSB1 bacterium]
MSTVSENNPPAQRTSGRLLARNSFINLLGRIAPLFVAIFAIPILITGLGTARFGVLTLAWMLVGYFSLFDLGIGRAVTKLISEKLGAGEEEQIPAIIWTSLFLILVFGVVGAFVVVVISPWLVVTILKIPETLELESLRSFYVLAIGIPIVISSIGLRGILEAKQRFDLINVVRISLGVFTYLGPIAVLFFSARLESITAVLVLGRVLAWFVYLFLCIRAVPGMRARITVNRSQMKPILRFGGWITVSNILSPVMQYMDRFLIGAMLSMTAVTYYVTPYEVVTKLLIVPSALVGVLFPAFSASYMRDSHETSVLFQRGIKFLFLILFPVVLLIVTVARGGLQLWLGGEFAEHSTWVLQILSIGIFVNSLGYLPFTMIQGVGRPELTAKLHLIEVPFYLVLLWWLIQGYGIVGAAIAWLGRVLIDLLCLCYLAQKVLPMSSLEWQRHGLFFMAAISILFLAMIPMNLAVNSIFLLVILFGFSLIAWFRILAPEERGVVQNFLNLGRVPK